MPSTSGSSRSRATASARRASCSASSTSTNSQCDARSISSCARAGLGSSPTTASAASVTARPSGIGSMNPTAPNCGIAVAARTSAPWSPTASSPPGRVEQRRQPVRIAAVVPGGGVAHLQIEGHGRVGRLDEPRRVERPTEVGDRLVVGVRVLVDVRRPEGEGDAPRRIDDRHREAGVAGVLGEQSTVAGRRGQRGRGPGVQRQAAAQRQLAVAHRAEQGVDERERRRRPGRGTTSPAASAASSRASTSSSGASTAAASRRASNSVPNVAAWSSRSRVSSSSSRSRWCSQPGSGSPPTSDGQVGDEQRVAVRLGEHLTGIVVSVADELGDLVAIETRQLHPAHGG